MQPRLPDPAALARDEARRINSNREQYLRFPIERILADASKVARESLLAGLTEFHRERMSKAPSTARYPEARPWVEHTLAVDRELQAQAGLTEDELAVVRSLQNFVTFRGFEQAARALRPRPAVDEKCRVAYLPETDRGELVIKNVDDPLTHWKPDPDPPRAQGPLSDLRTDGVGSGLHIDEEPDELFPLPVLAMLRHYASDVPGAVEFLTRYCPFWGRSNILLHDRQKRSAAVEKCSFKHIGVHPPDRDGKNHVSGMTCRDPDSTQGRHQRAQRQKYLDLFGLPQDGPDMAFWNGCAKFEAKLATALRELGPRPRAEDIFRLFTSPWPRGLNKEGLRLHPDQGLVGYTLTIRATLIEEGKFLRWQRSEDGKRFDARPQVADLRLTADAAA